MPYSIVRILLLVGCVLFMPLAARGQSSGRISSLCSSLSGLPLERSGKAMHAGSWDRQGHNLDCRSIAPGKTLVLLNYHGAGIVRHFWCTFPGNTAIRSQLILRMYWDGQKHPSVRVPLGAFFGVGFGQQVNYKSAPLEETSGGYNCWWPMPFHKGAYWTITNETKQTVNGFYWNIGFDAYKKVAARMLEFHALWRSENPVPPGENYVILRTEGRGQYVGTALFMQGLQGPGLGFLEGNAMVYIDDWGRKDYYQGIGPPKPGQVLPRIEGTGTEDYFCSGWYFANGPYSAPYHGCLIKENNRSRISAYRWYITDPIPFKKSIRFTIQVGAEDNYKAAYSSVAYWYQAAPQRAFSPLPPAASLLPVPAPPPFLIPGAIEGQTLTASAKATAGIVETQPMGGFGPGWVDNAQLWWHGQGKGAELAVQVPVKKAGKYLLTGYFTKAPDYGTFQILLHGHAVGKPIDAFASSVEPTGAIHVGQIHLQAGDNRLTIRMVGRDKSSSNYMFGLNALVLTPAP